MGLEHKITCDYCDQDITYTSNCVDYRLHLGNERKGVRNPNLPVTQMHIYPIIKQSVYFCGLGCLKGWANGEKANDKDK